MNDLEATQRRIDKLRQWMAKDTSPDDDTDASLMIHNSIADTEYHTKIQEGITLRKKHLAKAKGVLLDQQLRSKRHKGDRSLRKEINGVIYANNRVPYNLERGDLIGVAIASSKLNSQVRQSKEVVSMLTSKKEELDLKLLEAQGRNEQLKRLIESLKERLASDETPEDPMRAAQRMLDQERIRLSELKEHAKILKKRVENGFS